MDLPKGINNIVDPRDLKISVTDRTLEGAEQEASLRDINFDTIEVEDSFVDWNEYIVLLTASSSSDDESDLHIKIASDVLFDTRDLPGLCGLIQRYMESRD